MRIFQIALFVSIFINGLAICVAILLKEKIMNGLNNLNANITVLNTTIATLTSYVNDLKNTTGDSDVAVQVAADAVASANTTLTALLPTTPTA